MPSVTNDNVGYMNISGLVAYLIVVVDIIPMYRFLLVLGTTKFTCQSKVLLKKVEHFENLSNRHTESHTYKLTKRKTNTQTDI